MSQPNSVPWIPYVEHPIPSAYAHANRVENRTEFALRPPNMSEEVMQIQEALFRQQRLVVKVYLPNGLSANMKAYLKTLGYTVYPSKLENHWNISATKANEKIKLQL